MYNKKKIKNKKFYINLINSKFNMKGNIKKTEGKYINYWNYYFFLNNKKNIKKFILHDGPPYTNGKFHLGHIMNKIIKDIIIKFNKKIGFYTPFILGWDCHGMPIELKIKNNINNINNLYNLNYKNLLYFCKIFSKKIIFFQKKKTKSLGIFSNYKNIYRTLDNKNISEELRLIINFNKKKKIYINDIPSFWCFKCKNSLSKSEIYYTKSNSISLYTIFLYLKLNNILNKFKLKKKYIIGGCIIWTTTPWTIISNQNLCIDNEKIYIIINSIKGLFIILYKNIKKFKELYKINFFILNFCLGKEIINEDFLNPLFNLDIFYNRKTKLISNKNIVKNIGTGIIHIAPAYGIEDYKIFKKYNRNNNIINIISNIGYSYKSLPILKNLNIEDLNKFIIKYLYIYNKIININIYNHKYMYCYKHNKKIIYRISKQIFIKINFKKKLLKLLKNINFYPKNSIKRFYKIIKKRPNWNISRQKIWGLPISYIKKKKNNFIYKNILKILKIYSNYYEIYNIKIFKFLILYDIIGSKKIFYKKIYDILDVWFDSGTTHWHVLRGSHKYILKFPSNLCIEGTDQYRGWFQSSLITSYILNKKIPYKSLITHGFILDNNKEKLSKTLGNYKDYNKNFENLEIDILRLLFCNIEYTDDISLNNEILNQTIDIYRKIRNNIRFNINNIFDLNKNVSYLNLNFLKPLEKILIIYLNNKYNKTIFLYKNYNFLKINFFIKKFICNDINLIFLKILREKLYIYQLKYIIRKNYQIILFYFLKNFLKVIFPIIPFISQESWNAILKKKGILLKNTLYFFNIKKNNIFLNIIKFIIIKFTDFAKNLKKDLGFSDINFNFSMFISKKYFNFLKNIKNYLKIILNIYDLKINLINSKKIWFFIKINNYKKCIRCWNKYKIKFFKKNLCKKCIIINFKQNK